MVASLVPRAIITLRSLISLSLLRYFSPSLGSLPVATRSVARLLSGSELSSDMTSAATTLPSSVDAPQLRLGEYSLMSIVLCRSVGGVVAPFSVSTTLPTTPARYLSTNSLNSDSFIVLGC